MREFIATIVVLAIFMTLIPCLVFVSSFNGQKSISTSTDNNNSDVQIYFTKDKKSITYSSEEYIIGAVFAQMPADFEPEALKAQCVLANTYAQYRKNAEKLCPTENLHGAILSDNEKLYQGFFTEKQAKDFYGDAYENAYKKIKSAADDVKGLILTYENNPVIVAFHALSSGYTESAKNAWGEEIPYLQSVESLSDKEIDGVESKTIFSSSELKNRLTEKYSDMDFTLDENEWIKLTDVTDTGYVKKVFACGKEISASDFTEILGIASPCFSVSYKNDSFTFSSMGYGHLVGLSQYGANSMAQEGKDYKEILMHYYTSCEIH